MKTIYKYEITDVMTPVDIPHAFKILKADFQDGLLFVWVMVESKNIKESCTFKVFGTGHEIPYNPDKRLEFINTCFNDDGLVWHVFRSVDSL